MGLPDVRAEDEFDAIEVERCRLENDLDELLPLLGSLWLLEKDTDLLLRVILFQKKKKWNSVQFFVKLVKVFVLLLFVYFWNFQRSKINKSWKYSQYTTKVVWKGKMKLPFVKIFKRCSRDEMAYLSSWEWQMHIFEINIM